ncbi:MAG: glycosyltransferase family 39 protein [Anaerolineaceae bacterium]|nr:glycosyltransferase family 39 protein [Anaerolineaceae bacterium]
MNKHKWLLVILLVGIFASALAIRLYDLDDLPLDFHAARQLQSMIKARGMFTETVTNIEGWKKAFAIEQWKIMPTEEPEIVEHLAASTYQVLGKENLWFPRFYSVIFWLMGGLGLYLLLGRWFSKGASILGLLFYLFAPYGIEASRAFMPDPLMLMVLIWGCWAYVRWSEKPGWGRAVLAGLLFGLTIYIKLTTVFFVAGAIFGLALGQFGFKKAFQNLQLWAIGLLALLPAVLYNLLGIFVFKFIGQDAVENRLVPAMLLRPVSYLSWNNLIGVVVGFAAFLLSILGLFLVKNRGGRSLLIGLWAGYLLFGVVFIYYYTTHDYYHMPLFIMVSIGLAALGEGVLTKIQELLSPAWLARVLIVFVLVVGVSEICWQMRTEFKRVDYRPQAEFWQKLGTKLYNTSSLAMTEDYNGRLAYWGWYASSYMPDVDELRHRELTGHGADAIQTFQGAAQGKEYFLVTMLDDFDQLTELKQYLYATFPVLDQGEGYIIFDLRK